MSRSFAEGRFYRFGVSTGLANLFANGLALGFQKTLGKIFQPVNFYGRFAEYFFFEQALSPLWDNPPGAEIRILDLGSPKLFGLYLAARHPVKVWLTDISPLAIDEYRSLWAAIAGKAAGEVEFAIQDGRRLSFSDGTFHGAYAMSVLEHVQGDCGDGQACTEMARVLSPGGRLAVSVPLGSRYVEQRIRGRQGEAGKTTDDRCHFFQRIYDPPSFARRLREPLRSRLEHEQLITIYRRKPRLARALHGLRGLLGENGMGLLGFTNPLQSRLLNAAVAGMRTEFLTRVGPVHSVRDIYSDLVWIASRSHADAPPDRR